MPRNIVRAAFQGGDVAERWRLRKSRVTLPLCKPLGKAETWWTSPGFSVIHKSSQTWPWCYPRSTKEIVLPRILLPLCENCWGTSIKPTLSSPVSESRPTLAIPYCDTALNRTEQTNQQIPASSRWQAYRSTSTTASSCPCMWLALIKEVQVFLGLTSRVRRRSETCVTKAGDKTPLITWVDGNS